MAEVSELYGESVNDTKIEEHPEESLISQNDYKKLKQENEYYRQELYITRRQLHVNDAMKKDLLDANDALEKELMQCKTKVEATRKEAAEKFTVAKEEYEKHIADLETNLLKNKEEIKNLKNDIIQYRNILRSIHYPISQRAIEEALVPYKKDIEELNEFLQDRDEEVEKWMEKFANMEKENKKLDNHLQITLKHLEEKGEALENARESIRELNAKLKELELPRVAPASDTCKGNSLFAEVEDRRQMLLDKMKVITSKFKETKRALNMKMTEVKLLRAEKSAMARKLEFDAIDTLQENEDLRNRYTETFNGLISALGTEIKKSNRLQEAQLTGDSFNYARSLLITKGKEIIELNEKIGKQSIQILVQEDTKNNISRQLRYWRSKAMSLEAQIMAIKAQLETEQTNDNNQTLLRAIESCKISNNINFEKVCGNSELTLDKPENNICQESSTKVSKKPVINSTKESERLVCFTKDTKDTESKTLKKQAKKFDYPIICEVVEMIDGVIVSSTKPNK